MPQKLYSVEEVAGLLGLHVKTVRNYVREGHLKAVRIGKQYRVSAEDLERMTGRPPIEAEPVVRERQVDVSSIVEVDAIGPEEVIRLSNALTSAPKSRPREDEPLRIETIYNEERARLKIMLSGGVSTISSLLQFIGFYLERKI
ncbi:MAG TPA: helix-turn-helix domain-containing protein [Bryobacteraceae bacterium]|nr:helix-turn-helix domain-containing protein [Bryobacteraceae bacterium]